MISSSSLVEKICEKISEGGLDYGMDMVEYLVLNGASISIFDEDGNFAMKYTEFDIFSFYLLITITLIIERYRLELHISLQP